MYRPLRSLREGSWFKLICGASFQHLPAVRSLTLAYALAGADCVDVAADPAVIAAVYDAFKVASNWMADAQARGYAGEATPWLMVSLNDGEDPHFRKAEFDPALCPVDCPRPCEQVCPVQAIVFNQLTEAARVDVADQVTNRFLEVEEGNSGVIDSLCYGCGRCITICPIQNISARSYVSTPAAVAALVLAGVDAVEIHTQVGRLADFTRLWRAIQPYVDRLKLVAISCPDGEGLIDYLWSLYELISPLPCPLIWQTDGRPMSGDIGTGATKAAIKLGRKVLEADLPGYVQLAGGTNHHTVSKLQSLSLTKQVSQSAYISGVAYGSYARSLLAPVLEQLEQPATASRSSPSMRLACLEEYPELLWQAVDAAYLLVSQLKLPQPGRSSLVKSRSIV